MKFKEFLQRHNARALAKKLKCTHAAVYYWIAGANKPSLEMAYRILDFADGELLMTDIFPRPKKKKAKR